MQINNINPHESKEASLRFRVPLPKETRGLCASWSLSFPIFSMLLDTFSNIGVSFVKNVGNLSIYSREAYIQCYTLREAYTPVTPSGRHIGRHRPSGRHREA